MGQNVTNIANKSNCLSAEYHWVQKPYNFDNLLQVCPASHCSAALLNDDNLNKPFIIILAL